MDQQKLVEEEAVGQSLRMEVVSNEPLIGPDPSVSTGTAKSVKLSSMLQINLQAKKRTFLTVVTTLFAQTNRGQCSLRLWLSFNAPMPRTSDSITLQLSVYPCHQIKYKIAKFQFPFLFFAIAQGKQRHLYATYCKSKGTASRRNEFIQKSIWEACPSDESTPRA